MFGPIWSPHDAADLAAIKSGARRPHRVNEISINRQHHCRDACLLDRARHLFGAVMSRMLSPLSASEQREFERCLRLCATSLESPSAANTKLGIARQQTLEWYLRIRILGDIDRVIPARRKSKFRRINLGGYLAKSEIAARRLHVERIGAINICACRGDESEIDHRQRAMRGGKRSVLVPY